MTSFKQSLPRIFISHSYKDDDFSTRLTNDLRHVLGDDSAVWFDKKGGLQGGDIWWEKIREEIAVRNIFIVILSPDSIKSPWVHDEIDIAWLQKNSSSHQKRIIPILFRQCEIRDDLSLFQMISFLPPKTYGSAFNELLLSLGLNAALRTDKVNDPETILVRQMEPQIEVAFAENDWPDVIRKVDYLIKRAPSSIKPDIYRMQGLALFKDSDAQRGREALDSALALISDRIQRLTLLKDYANALASLSQWSEVIRHSNEALQLAPNDSYWLTLRQRAYDQLGEHAKASTTPHTIKSIEVFFSYARKDEELRDELELQLSILKRQGLISAWYDREISAGKEWMHEIDDHLNTAQIIILLISANFVASDYCYGIEMMKALKRHEAGEARVIPVILRAVDWRETPFGKLQALPKDAKPITSWNNRDEAFLSVARGVRKAVEELTINL
jgi:tetratricopeptide (TPR) repeat protein